MRLIDGDALYKQLQDDEELARKRVLDTESSLPYSNNLNPAYTRYLAQMDERTRLKHMVADAPAIEPDVPERNVGDINKFIDGLEEIFADLRERHVDDSVCGLCEYDGAYIGQSGDWYNECSGFEKDDCFKLSGKIRKEWTDEIIKALLSAQPEPRYTEEELRVFQHGISLSLLSKRSSQHWQYDEDTATEIKFLERLYEKVGADMRGEQE